jgi:hypothetical protein
METRTTLGNSCGRPLLIMPCLRGKGQLLDWLLSAAFEPFDEANWPGQAVPDMPIFTLPAASGSKLHSKRQSANERALAGGSGRSHKRRYDLFVTTQGAGANNLCESGMIGPLCLNLVVVFVC